MRRLLRRHAQQPSDTWAGLDVAERHRHRRRHHLSRHSGQPDQHPARPDSGTGRGLSGVTEMSSTEIAVRCRGVRKEFGNGAGKVLALRGVDLDARYGAMTLLVGPSGCGKTTLLSVIAGLLDSDGGEVEVLGERIERLPGSQQILFRRKNLGFVFQQYNLLPALTAAENAAVPLLAAGTPRRKAMHKAMDLLVTLGMGERVNALPKQLSGGEQQRGARARSLMHEAPWLAWRAPE